MKRKTIMKRLNEVDSAPGFFTPADFDHLDSTGTGFETVAQTEVRRPHFLDPTRRVQLALVAYEEFTNGTGDGAQDTYSLAHNLVQSPATTNDLVLYQGNTPVDPDSVDYSADSFAYTDDGSGDPVHAYYATDAQAEVEVRKVAPSNVDKKVGAFDNGRSVIREQGRDPLTFDFDDPLDGVVPSKWRVQVRINSPFTFQWEDDTHADAEATNAVLSLPFNRAKDRVADLDRFIRRHASEDGAPR